MVNKFSMGRFAEDEIGICEYFSAKDLEKVIVKDLRSLMAKSVFQTADELTKSIFQTADYLAKRVKLVAARLCRELWCRYCKV